VYASWEKVIKLKAKYIVPAHGKPFSIEILRENMFKYIQDDLFKFF
jgi:hypothetical protein